MEYGARIKGKYTRGMAAYIMEETEKRERREYDQVVSFLVNSGTAFQASYLATHPLDISEIGMEGAVFAVAWESEYGYPVHVIWHVEGFEVRTARYIGRGCLSLFPGLSDLLEMVDRQNAQVSALIIHMSQEQIQRAANVDLETAQRWMMEAEERDPMPEYDDDDGTRRNRTHNRFGERVR